MGWNLTKAADWNDMPAVFYPGWVEPVSYVVKFVPEPSTLALPVASAIGLLTWAWRRPASDRPHSIISGMSRSSFVRP
jgi:hypothetical protein